jgi:hypothetical protein
VRFFSTTCQGTGLTTLREAPIKPQNTADFDSKSGEPISVKRRTCQLSEGDCCHDWLWKFFSESAGQAAAGDQADTHAHHLNDGREEPSDECDPQNRSAEPRPTTE